MNPDSLGDRTHAHIKWLFGTPDNFLFAVYALCALAMLGLAYILIADATDFYVSVTSEWHRRRMQVMDKEIELEKAKAANAPSVCASASITEAAPPEPKPTGEAIHAEPPA